MIRTLIHCFLSLGIFAATADAGLTIILEARDANGAPLASPVAAGTTAQIDILLSVDGADDPLPDLRHLRFDFLATSPGISVGAFAWKVSSNAYIFFGSPPNVDAVSTLSESSSILLTLTATPTRVATVEVTIDGTGTLDITNPNATDTNSGARFRASFDFENVFSLFDGNLSGGTLDFVVDDGGGSTPPPVGGGGDGTPQPTFDSDNDGVINANDAFPSNPLEIKDTDGDGVGDNADTDDDGDGVPDAEDAFPLNQAEVLDTDGDGIGDNLDPDDDGDGVVDSLDALPLNPAETVDSDADGVGDNTDVFPDDPTETTDSNGDGIGDNADNSDGDTQTSSPPSPVRLCGVGMLAPSLLIFAALCGVRPSRRNRNVTG
ncbi:MAG: thrombospondin type 3 repeat-containing protein [Phycisphaerales bacterium]|nr:thrombospondin type 3 repeat-containing protein [Phycisphaerales bacterium]